MKFVYSKYNVYLCSIHSRDATFIMKTIDSATHVLESVTN